ncbi:MAG: ATP-binding protein [Firmicutes bacterium]|nr:ATP-binding protein [Bacillota bacterium]
MAYSAEVIAAARARLAEAKAEREAENRQHLAEAYEKVPRIHEIDRQLRVTMAEAFRAAFAAGEDGTQAMERVRDRNLALQRERRELAAQYFEEGFLDDGPICERCGGEGYVGTAMCECLAELCRQEQKKALTLLAAGKESFGQFRLDYYPDRTDAATGMNIRAVMANNFEFCRNYAYSFTEKSENLLFSGDTGLGKTFLSACIARAVAEGGHSVIYESASRLFATMERARFNGDERAQAESAKFAECELLIVDDLGTEMPSQFINAALYGLVNDRLLTGRPTIVSTNLTSEEIARRYTPQIASRLRSFRRVPFMGEDIRVMKSRGK